MNNNHNPFDSFDDDEMDDFLDFDALYDSIIDANNTKQIKYIDSQELEEAIEFFIFEDVEKALVVTEYALSIFPQSVTFLLYLAEIQIENNNDKKALEFLNTIENSEPYNTRVYLLKASILIKNDQVDKAITEYHRALFNDVDDIVAVYEDLACAYLSINNFKDAIKCYKKCIDVESDNPYLYYALVDIYINTNKFSEGILFFQSLLRANPHDVNALFVLGKLFEKNENYSKSIRCFDKVLNIQNDHFDALSEKIIVLKKLGKYEEVIGICKELKSVFFPHFIIELAELYLEMGHVDETLELYLNLYKELPEDIDVIVGIASCYRRVNEYNKAIAYLESGLKLFPDSIDLLLIKALLFHEMDDDAAAINITTKIIDDLDLDIFSENEFLLTELYFEMNKINLAIEFLSSFLNSDFCNAKLHFLLAAAYYRSFSKSEAYECFDTALSFSYNDYHIFFDKCMLAHGDDVFYDLLDKYKK